MVLPEGLENCAFAEAGIASLVISKSVKQMDGDPFFRCRDLKDVAVLAGMECLPDGLFVVSGITHEHYGATIHAPPGPPQEDFAKRNNLKFTALQVKGAARSENDVGYGRAGAVISAAHFKELCELWPGFTWTEHIHLCAHMDSNQNMEFLQVKVLKLVGQLKLVW